MSETLAEIGIDGREKERVTEPVQIAPFEAALERPDHDNAADVDDYRQAEGDDDPGDQPTVARSSCQA